MLSIKNVVVGISGGVDSAVAALLLKNKGFKVTGVFMKNWDLLDEKGVCSILNDLEDAKYTCNKLKIPFQEVDFVKEYWNEVFSGFIEDYEHGMTPNPDILCNKFIKFRSFYDYAFSNLGADALATGHYAKSTFGDYLEKYDQGKKAKLIRAKDIVKDQSFFLSQISQTALQKTMFPLGNLTKSEVKEIAIQNGLEKLAKKTESMGICFIGSRNFQEFMSQYVKPKPGKFINIITGKVEGVHNGIHLWTIGQRCKIGGGKNAFYVVKKVPNTSDMFVAPGYNHPSLFSSIFYTGEPYWISDPPDLTYKGEFDFKVQRIKSVSKCEVVQVPSGNMVCVLDEPKRAIAPGQYSVFYNGSECLGSARIMKIGPSEYSLGNQIPSDYDLLYDLDESYASVS